MYYYSDDNSNTYGPFTKEQLLPKINRNTLVYYDGISWTNAENIQELKSHFGSQQAHNVSFHQEIPYQNHKSEVKNKFFAAPFSFDGRIRRMEFGVSLIIYMLIYSSLLKMIGDNSFLSLIFIPLVWFFLAQGAKRCHDRGNSGWYQIIPFYIFWMLFAEGDSHNNAYGSSPK